MDCVFCRIVEEEEPARILSETGHSMALLDAFPLARGHTLIIPKSHRVKVQDMSPEESADLFAMVHRLAPRVDGLTGATLIAIHDGKEAGQAIPHLHVHMVPRSTGDSATAIHGMFGPAVEMSDGELEDVRRRLGD